MTLTLTLTLTLTRRGPRVLVELSAQARGLLGRAQGGAGARAVPEGVEELVLRVSVRWHIYWDQYLERSEVP